MSTTPATTAIPMFAGIVGSNGGKARANVILARAKAQLARVMPVTAHRGDMSGLHDVLEEYSVAAAHTLPRGMTRRVSRSASNTSKINALAKGRFVTNDDIQPKTNKYDKLEVPEPKTTEESLEDYKAIMRQVYQDFYVNESEQIATGIMDRFKTGDAFMPIHQDSITLMIDQMLEAQLEPKILPCTVTATRKQAEADAIVKAIEILEDLPFWYANLPISYLFSCEEFAEMTLNATPEFRIAIYMSIANARTTPIKFDAYFIAMLEELIAYMMGEFELVDHNVGRDSIDNYMDELTHMSDVNKRMLATARAIFNVCQIGVSDGSPAKQVHFNAAMTESISQEDAAVRFAKFKVDGETPELTEDNPELTGESLAIAVEEDPEAMDGHDLYTAPPMNKGTYAITPYFIAMCAKPPSTFPPLESSEIRAFVSGLFNATDGHGRRAYKNTDVIEIGIITITRLIQMLVHRVLRIDGASTAAVATRATPNLLVELLADETRYIDAMLCMAFGSQNSASFMDSFWQPFCRIMEDFDIKTMDGNECAKRATKYFSSVENLFNNVTRVDEMLAAGEDVDGADEEYYREEFDDEEASADFANMLAEFYEEKEAEKAEKASKPKSEKDSKPKTKKVSKTKTKKTSKPKTKKTSKDEPDEDEETPDEPEDDEETPDEPEDDEETPEDEDEQPEVKPKKTSKKKSGRV